MKVPAGQVAQALHRTNGRETFRWENGIMVGLGDLSGGLLGSSAYGVSDDGSVVVGHSYGTQGDEAFRWSNGVIMTAL